MNFEIFFIIFASELSKSWSLKTGLLWNKEKNTRWLYPMEWKNFRKPSSVQLPVATTHYSLPKTIHPRTEYDFALHRWVKKKAALESTPGVKFSAVARATVAVNAPTAYKWAWTRSRSLFRLSPSRVGTACDYTRASIVPPPLPSDHLNMWAAALWAKNWWPSLFAACFIVFGRGSLFTTATGKIYSRVNLILAILNEIGSVTDLFMSLNPFRLGYNKWMNKILMEYFKVKEIFSNGAE